MDIALEIQQVIIFFIFVAPGFLFSRTYLPFRPIQYYKQTTLFEQSALALVGSAIIHGILLSIAALVILVGQAMSQQPLTLSQLVDPNVPLAQVPLPMLAWYLFVSAGYLLLSLVVSRRAAIFFGRRTASRQQWWTRIIGENPPENTLFWPVILQREALQKGILAPRITIRLRNGDTFEGHLNRMKLVGDEDDTIELAITQVTYHAASAGTFSPALEDNIVLLQSKDILWLSRVDT